MRVHRRWRAVCAATLIGLAGSPAAGQVIVEAYVPVEGYLRIGPEPERMVAMTERGHTLLLPEDVEARRGVLVLLDARRFRSEGFVPQAGELDGEALARGVAVLHITTGNPLDFLFTDAEMHDLADRIGMVLTDNGLAGKPLFLAGLSLAGTRALKLAEFLRIHRSRHVIQVTAVAIVDAPLDMVRFWAAERAAAELGFHPAATDEGHWVTYVLETNLGGTPAEARDRYVAYSPYVHGVRHGGNAVHLRDMPVRAYHEPDVDWWIENRRKSYYDMNSIDLAALVNELRSAGNGLAELITTHNQRDGYAEGSSPHTWSIVDNGELIDWFLGHVEE